MIRSMRVARARPTSSGWPDATNTGTLGASLTTVPVVGSLWRESTDGVGLFTNQVIDGNTYNVYSNYDFQATTSLMYLDGVNPYIKFKTSNFYTSGLVNNTSAQVQTTAGMLGLIFEDCTMNGGSAYHNRNIEDGNAKLVVRRCNMTNFGNSSVEKNSAGGGGNARSMEVRDSYFYEPRGWQQADHIDGIQTDGGITDCTIVHNTVYVEPYGAADGDETYGPTSCINITAALGDIIGNVLVDNNQIAGGGYCVYCSTQGASFTGSTVIVRNNVFNRQRFSYLAPTYVSMWGKESANNSILYPTNIAPQLSAGSGAAWTGNTFEDGTPVTYAMATS